MSEKIKGYKGFNKDMTCKGKQYEENTTYKPLVFSYDRTENEWENYILTAYCSCEKCCGKSDGITASGTIATPGRTVAVDTNNIPYGTTVEIDGFGTYVAEDCGGAIKGNQIDIYFENHEDALDFGKKELKVIILEGKNEQRKSTNRNAF